MFYFASAHLLLFLWCAPKPDVKIAETILSQLSIGQARDGHHNRDCCFRCAGMEREREERRGRIIQLVVTLEKSTAIVANMRGK